MFGLFKKKPALQLEPFLDKGFKLANAELQNLPATLATRQALDLFNRGVKEAQNGKLPQAFGLFRDSADASPSVTSLLNALLITALSGYEKETLDLIVRTKTASEITGYPYPAFCHLYMALGLLKINGPAVVALPILDMALTAAREHCPTLVQAVQHKRASLLNSMLRPGEALVAIDEAIGTASLPEAIDLVVLKATIMGELGDFRGELAIYDQLDRTKAAQGSSPDPHLLCNRAIALWRLGSLEEALACFDRAQLQLAALGLPKDPAIEMNRALVYISQQQYQKAKDTLLEARQLAIASDKAVRPQLELNLASAYAYLGEFDKQLEFVLLGEAAANKTGMPPDPRFYDSRADALIALGRIDEAWAVYVEAEQRYAKLGMPVPPVLYEYGKKRADDLGSADRAAEFERKLAQPPGSLS